MKIVKKSTDGSVSINGKTYPGRSISITPDGLFVDGELQEDVFNGPINVVVHGDVDILENTAGSVEAQNVGTIKTVSASVRCSKVSGAVTTVSGDVHCSGDIRSVSTLNGDIINKNQKET